MRPLTVLVRLLPVALVVAVSLVIANPVAAPPLATVPLVMGAQPAPAETSRNADRARATFAAIQAHFAAPAGRYHEVYPVDAGAYSSMWPLTQTVEGAQLAAPLLAGAAVPAAQATFAAYWDAGVAPGGYAASMLPPLGTGDRKFFDDNAWAGLALVQDYRASGDPEALSQARRVFDFDVSGWDSDPTHADPGGVWWSQQMPNPRFRHRNTVSTAASAELALQLYESTGGTEPDYLDWGVRMYQWVDTYLAGANGLYGDHVDEQGIVDGGQLTYNQGTMIGAAVLLYRFTGDSTYLAHARMLADTSLETFGSDGFSQQPGYNAVFFRNLLLLEAETNDGGYRAAMQSYADHVWDSLRDEPSGLFAFVYGRNRSTGNYRLLDQAAMLQIYAALALDPTAYSSLT